MKTQKPYTPENVRKQLQDMRVSYHEHKIYRKIWDSTENDELKRLFYDGYGISDIAVCIGRSEKATIKQIDKLELYKKIYNKSQKIKLDCKCPTCTHNGTDDCIRGCEYAGKQ